MAACIVVSACGSDGDDNDVNTPVVTVESVEPIVLTADTPGVGNSVYDNIFNNTDLSTLLAAIDTAGLANLLDDEALDFTVFAPDNAAFQKLEDSNPDDEIIPALTANPDGLAAIITFHVLPNTIDAAGAYAASPSEFTTLNGESILLGPSDSSPSGLAIGDADVTILDSDYLPGTSVGVVHIINAVVLPN